MRDQYVSIQRHDPIRISHVLIIIGIVFVAFNLRPAITGIGPLIESIRADFGLSNAAAGFITTLPLIAFSILSPVAPKLGRQFGMERTIFIGLLVLVLGICIRSVSGIVAALFIGTSLIGLGIAVSNVLLPGIVKDRFPHKVGLVTSMYSTAMGISAAIASGVSVPLANGLGLGWQHTLLLWALLAGGACLFWLPVLFQSNKSRNQKAMAQAAPSSESEKAHTQTVQQVKMANPTVWKSSLAWQVTVYMGLQSMLFYCLVAWFPTIIHNQGVSITAAGWLLSTMLFTGLIGSLMAPILAQRWQHQKGIALGIATCFFVGLCGLLIGGNVALLLIWTIVLGIGQGAGIAFALTLFALRTTNAQQAANLSGMAQSIGYLLAACGPVFLGFMYDQSQSWTVPIIVLLVVTIIMGIAGYGAGRDRYVSN